MVRIWMPAYEAPADRKCRCGTSIRDSPRQSNGPRHENDRDQIEQTDPELDIGDIVNSGDSEQSNRSN